MTTMELAPFGEIAISTQTIIGISNVTIDTEKLFHAFAITPCSVIERKRGRRKKDRDAPTTVYNRIASDQHVTLKDGDIITVKFGDLIRGIDLSHKKRKCKFFRNALTVVMFSIDKLVNFKITKNGRFQFTGCKSVDHAVRCTEHMWSQITASPEQGLYAHEPIPLGSHSFDIKFLTVMTNIDFNIGFPIDRERLDEFVNTRSEYNSLLDTSFGYTGVNVKIRVNRGTDFDMPCQQYDPIGQTWMRYTTRYSDFISDPAHAKKYGTKTRYNTFLIFHSGHIIMSGYNPVFMEECFTAFRHLLLSNRKTIEESLGRRHG